MWLSGRSRFVRQPGVQSEFTGLGGMGPGDAARFDPCDSALPRRRSQAGPALHGTRERGSRPGRPRRGGSGASSPWCKSRVAPRRAACPADKARRARIPPVFDRGATPSPGMRRSSNAAGVAPRAAKPPLEAVSLASSSVMVNKSAAPWLRAQPVRSPVLPQSARAACSSFSPDVDADVRRWGDGLHS